ncbi:MAG: hypothetical protein V3U22_03060 [Vicinamibacteria bacterium]
MKTLFAALGAVFLFAISASAEEALENEGLVIEGDCVDTKLQLRHPRKGMWLRIYQCTNGTIILYPVSLLPAKPSKAEHSYEIPRVLDGVVPEAIR